MESSISFEGCPFPIACIASEGTTRHANLAWHEVSARGAQACDALGLQGSDRDDFSDLVRAVADDRVPAWVDLDVGVLAVRRWSRCHIWPAQDSDDVIVAVVSLRETRDLDLSRVDTDHIERILEHTADAITVVDRDTSIRFASGIATRWLGVSGSAHEGKPALSFVFVDDHHILIDAFNQCMQNPRVSVKARFRAVHESGDLIWVEGIGTNMFDDPAIRGILVTLNDITELVEARSTAERNRVALETEKKRYEALAHFTQTGVFELDAAHQLTFRNERFRQLTGMARDDQFTWELFDERDRDALRVAIEGTVVGTTTQVTVRLASGTASGDQRWLTIRAARQDGGRLLASIEDRTVQVEEQAELTHRADHDDLTGLPNREHLLERLEELTAAGESIAVLFLDLDNFKDINDGLGHQFGDRVLIEVADRIREVVRPNDIVGRLHGDEFLVVCRNTSDLSTAREIASRVVTAVGEPLESAIQRLIVSGSVGIAMSNAKTETPTPEQLLVAADVAMYEAKRRGGSRSVNFTDDLGRRAADRLRLHGEVQRASELNELELHYQPIVCLDSGDKVRAEALVRWHHPTQGFILPERFIPDIEKSELIDELGLWIVERVIADLAAAGPDAVPVNVNVSPRQLADGSFARTALNLLEQYDVPGDLLTIEITELVMMEEFAPVEAQLRLLQGNGVGVAVDDFGTGYSSLAYLQRFQFDQIKIDGVFIANVDTSTSDQAIVQSIIDLATALGASPVAEKVERQAQVDTLIEMGCSYGQGFLLGKPEPLATPGL